MLDFALQYAARGWRVFPVHTGLHGRCSCGRLSCKDQNKHPRVRAWQKEATTDPAQIEAWWRRFPDSNIGIVTGEGRVVIDLDSIEEARTFAALCARHGGLPATLAARTGRGAHLWFLGDVGGSRKVDGILIRGDGGYVVAPPSLHRSGVQYAWTCEVHPIEMPQWLVEWANSGRGARSTGLLAQLGPVPAYLSRGNSAPSRELSPALPIAWTAEEEARIREALAAVPASCERDKWLRIGMALHSLHWEKPDGTDRGLELWDEWSSTGGDKYAGIFDLETRWKSFKRSGVGLGSLYRIAEDAGWGGLAAKEWRPLPEAYEVSNSKDDGEREPSKTLTAVELQNLAGILSPANHTQSSAIHRTTNLVGVNGQKERPHEGAESKEVTPEAKHERHPLVNGRVYEIATRAESPLIELNRAHCVIGDVGGKCLVLGWVPSKVDESVQVPSFQSFKSFEERFRNRYVTVTKHLAKGDKEEPAPLGLTWLKWHRRRTYEGLDLSPNGEEVLPGNVLNLWRGWGVEPRAGKWPRMQEHVTEVLANGNAAEASYIFKWAAWTVQNPSEPTESALVFRGSKGSGKGTFARALRQLFGQHGLQVFHSRHLVGNFNGHLRACILLYADEAFWAGDRQGEGVLKGLITEPTLAIEQKGVDVVHWKNRVHLVMTANAEWVVPASGDERRYAVFDVSSRRARKKGWFDPLHRELKEGGLAAMLHDLLRVDLGDWHPREGISTRALQDQKARSMDALGAWWENALQDGAIGQMEPGSRIVPAILLMGQIRETAGKMRDAGPAAIGRFLEKFGWKKLRRAQGIGWEAPPLEEGRRQWEETYGSWRWEIAKGEWN